MPRVSEGPIVRDRCFLAALSAQSLNLSLGPSERRPDLVHHDLKLAYFLSPPDRVRGRWPMIGRRNISFNQLRTDDIEHPGSAHTDAEVEL
jgi:hypothetical protein